MRFGASHVRHLEIFLNSPVLESADEETMRRKAHTRKAGTHEDNWEPPVQRPDNLHLRRMMMVRSDEEQQTQTEVGEDEERV